MKRSTIISALTFVIALCVSLWSVRISQLEIESVANSTPLDFYVPGVYYGLHRGLIAAYVGLIGAAVGFVRAWLRALGMAEAVLHASVISLAVQLLSYLFAPLLIIFFFPVPFFELGFVVFLVVMAVWALPAILLGIRSSVQANLSVSIAGPLILVAMTVLGGVSSEMIHTMGRPLVLALGITGAIALWLGIRHGFRLAIFWSSTYYIGVSFFYWFTRIALLKCFGIRLLWNQVVIDVGAIVLLAITVMVCAYLADIRRKNGSMHSVYSP